MAVRWTDVVIFGYAPFRLYPGSAALMEGYTTLEMNKCWSRPLTGPAVRLALPPPAATTPSPWTQAITRAPAHFEQPQIHPSAAEQYHAASISNGATPESCG